jgi:hypothetical protein
VDEIAQALPDCFISRAGAHPADVAMAAKVGQIIETEGHRVVLQQWDFANRNFMERMDAALASGARVVAILTPQYLATDYCAAEWMHALDGDPLNRKGRLIVLRAAECEPKGLLRTIASWDLAPIRDRDDLLTDIVKAAIMPDAERRHVGAARTHWREARALLHEAIKPTPSFTGRDEHLQKIRDGSGWTRTRLPPLLSRQLSPALAASANRPWRASMRGSPKTVTPGSGGSMRRATLAPRAGVRSNTASPTWAITSSEDWRRLRIAAKQHCIRSTFSPWLLIFDNVDDPRVLEVWRPRGKVHVLVTSRISNWSLGVSPIEVDAWEPPEAIAYLTREIGRANLSRAQLAELAEVLGRLPLALSHAAAYLRRRKPVTIKDYLDVMPRSCRSRCPWGPAQLGALEGGVHRWEADIRNRFLSELVIVSPTPAPPYRIA